MNLKMRKLLEINEGILRFMGRTAGFLRRDGRRNSGPAKTAAPRRPAERSRPNLGQSAWQARIPTTRLRTHADRPSTNRLLPSLAEPARGCCRPSSAGASPCHVRRFQTVSQPRGQPTANRAAELKGVFEKSSAVGRGSGRAVRQRRTAAVAEARQEPRPTDGFSNTLLAQLYPFTGHSTTVLQKETPKFFGVFGCRAGLPTGKYPRATDALAPRPGHRKSLLGAWHTTPTPAPAVPRGRAAEGGAPSG
jgi:hypothetical protein